MISFPPVVPNQIATEKRIPKGEQAVQEVDLAIVHEDILHWKHAQLIKMRDLDTLRAKGATAKCKVAIERSELRIAAATKELEEISGRVRVFERRLALLSKSNSKPTV
jgi:hypothetical protein